MKDELIGPLVFIGFGLVLAGLAIYMTMKYRPCDECDGVGQLYDNTTDSINPCVVCQGKGHILREPPSLP